MVTASASDRLREILHVRKLPAARRVLEILRKLRQLAGQCRIAARCRGLRSGLQIVGYLQSDLLILRRIRLLQFL